MNKAVKLLFAIGMVGIFASTTFAEVSIGAWGRGIFSPLTFNHKGEIVPNNNVSWGGYSPRVGWNIRGNSDNVGFHVDMNADGGSIQCHDQQKIWVKPVEMLTLEVGPSIYYDALRGNATFGAWNYLRFAGQGDEDFTFTRGIAGENKGSAGFLASLNTSGLHLFAALTNQSEDKKITDSTEIYKTSIMFKRGQYGAGYDIPDFGTVRAQFIGKSYVPTDTEELADANKNKEFPGYGTIEAAIKIDKLVEKLYVDLGVSLPTVEIKKSGEKTAIAAYIKYGLEAATIHALTKMKLANPDDDKDGLGMHIGVGSDINAGPVQINADVRFFNNYWLGTGEDGDNSIGILAGVSKGFSNGKIAAGIEFITASEIADGWGMSKGTEDSDKNMWAVPIVLEYWF